MILEGVLVHQEMARIPVAVIAANQDEKQQIEHEIAKLECFKDRKYTVYCLPIDKMHYMKYFFFQSDQIFEKYYIVCILTYESFIKK